MSDDPLPAWNQRWSYLALGAVFLLGLSLGLELFSRDEGTPERRPAPGRVRKEVPTEPAPKGGPAGPDEAPPAVPAIYERIDKEIGEAKEELHRLGVLTEAEIDSPEEWYRARRLRDSISLRLAGCHESLLALGREADGARMKQAAVAALRAADARRELGPQSGAPWVKEAEAYREATKVRMDRIYGALAEIEARHERFHDESAERARNRRLFLWGAGFILALAGLGAAAAWVRRPAR